MKAWKDFEAKKTGSGREILPAGGYVCEIKDAKVEEYHTSKGDFSSLILAIEIVEGAYTGFWKKDYENNPNEDNKKWRGRYAISIPKDDGSEQDAWTKRAFGNFIWSVQESNPGYAWGWDEKTLKGKKLGVLYRNKEWAFNDQTGWTTEAAGSVTVDDCRAGNYKLPKDKPLKNRPQGESRDVAAKVEDEMDLPF